MYPISMEEEQNGSFVFTANVDVENIDKLIRAFGENLEEPCFFILEIPASEQDEQELRKLEIVVP